MRRCWPESQLPAATMRSSASTALMMTMSLLSLLAEEVRGKCMNISGYTVTRPGPQTWPMSCLQTSVQL